MLKYAKTTEVKYRSHIMETKLEINTVDLKASKCIQEACADTYNLHIYVAKVMLRYTATL